MSVAYHHPGYVAVDPFPQGGGHHRPSAATRPATSVALFVGELIPWPSPMGWKHYPTCRDTTVCRFHEAGHAVAALDLGIPLEGVGYDDGKTGNPAGGVCSTTPGYTIAPWHDLVFTCAGPAAEEIFFVGLPAGNRWRMGRNEDGDAHDGQHCHDLLARMGLSGPAATAKWQQGHDAAKDILRRRANDVKSIAACLTANCWIEGELLPAVLARPW